MADVPITRPSLLLRLRDGGDHQAWSQFVALYGPLVYRYARSRGLGDADAADVAQLVFQAVSQEIRRWQYDPRRGKFRSWLLVVTRNQLGKYLEQARRNLPAPAGGDSQEQLSQCVALDREAEIWDREYQQRAFQVAADRVRLEFSDASWQAFWRTAVHGQNAKTVGQTLGMTVGAVYTARSRVLGRIKQVIEEFDEDEIEIPRTDGG